MPVVKKSRARRFWFVFDMCVDNLITPHIDFHKEICKNVSFINNLTGETLEGIVPQWFGVMDSHDGNIKAMVQIKVPSTISLNAQHINFHDDTKYVIKFVEFGTTDNILNAKIQKIEITGKQRYVTGE